MSASVIPVPRWAVSFADLCLLLLGFFVILHAQDGNAGKVAAGMRQAFGAKASAAGPVQTDYLAAKLFEPGEAILRPVWRDAVAQLGAGAAKRNQKVRIDSDGADPATRRLDGWELAAARTAAIARVMRQAGVRDDRIEIAMPPLRGGAIQPQTIGIIVG